MVMDADAVRRITDRRWSPVVALAVTALLAALIPGRVPSPLASSSPVGATGSIELADRPVGAGGDPAAPDVAAPLGGPIRPVAPGGSRGVAAPGQPGRAPGVGVPDLDGVDPGEVEIPASPDPPAVDAGPLGPVLEVAAPFATPICGGLGVVGFVVTALQAAGSPLDPQMVSTLIFTSCGLIPLPERFTECPTDRAFWDAVNSIIGDDAPIPRPRPGGQTLDTLAALEGLLMAQQLGVAETFMELLACEPR